MKTMFVPLCLTLMLSIAGCQEASTESTAINSDMRQISGSISYRERVALTNEAVLEVSLRDVSIADMPAPLIAQQEFHDPGQVPIRYELSYSAAQIDQRRSYAVQARITDRGRLMFINDTYTPVLTRGADNEVNMMLVSVPENSMAEESGIAEAPGFEIEGMFRYMADAALFRDCRDNRVYPVAMEAQYIEVERAYLNSGVEAGQEVFVKLRGRYLSRPPMEGNINKVNLIVDKLNEISDDHVCSPDLHAELQNTYWRLLEIDGKPIDTPEGMREAHLVLDKEDLGVRGFAGCNNFFGNYETDGESLTFSPLGSTMMACPEGMDTEQKFLQLLGATTRAVISGQIMSLYADDQLLARFEAVYL